MTDEDILFLKNRLATNDIYWMPDSTTARKVTCINKQADEEDELCGIFSNGEYVVLYNCSLSDFAEVKRLER